MPETINCVHCKAPLRLPDQFIGQEVRCPSCQKTFTAQLPAAPPPAARPQAEEERADEPPSPRYEDRPARRRRPSQEDDDYPRPRRPRYDDDYLQAHNGSTILTLGILTIVMAFCCWPVGLIMGIIAIVMAGGDLNKIRSGTMDPGGQSQINAGRTCAIVGLVFCAIVTVLSCIGGLGHH